MKSLSTKKYNHNLKVELSYLMGMFRILNQETAPQQFWENCPKEAGGELRLHTSFQQWKQAVWTSKIRYQVKECSILCMGKCKPLDSMDSFFFIWNSAVWGQILFPRSPCFLCSLNSSAVIVEGGSICRFLVLGALFHIWRPEIADSCDIACLFKWQEIFSFHNLKSNQT